MPRFNRECRVVEVLLGGSAVLLVKTWDSPGVLAAGRAIGEALEHPAAMRWDLKPPSIERWREEDRLARVYQEWLVPTQAVSSASLSRPRMRGIR
jgi:hypothetical protein